MHSSSRTAGVSSAWKSGMEALATFTAMGSTATISDSEETVLQKVQVFWEGVAAHWLQPEMHLPDFAEAAYNAHKTGKLLLPDHYKKTLKPFLCTALVKHCTAGSSTLARQQLLNICIGQLSAKS